MKNILVTGGAGYIGSHCCKALKTAGYNPISYDNLSTGWARSVKYGPLENGDLRDRARLDETFSRWKPKAVMHFAALSQVGEAVKNPGKYWRDNILSSLTLIEAAVHAECFDFIFSSTCATYGDQDGVLLAEDSPQSPINAYGASKRAIEDMLRDFGNAHGLRSVIFRYFNVAGADPDAECGEFHDPETHLIPIILEVASGERSTLTVFGEDYPTPDGTCIRDFVHVSDLVDAHILGLKWLEAGKGNRIFCLGSGKGFSVREVIERARRLTNRPIPVEIGPRRRGDAAKLVLGSARATVELGWEPKRSSLELMISDAWQAYSSLEWPVTNSE
ncbi:UDP-glucose 4-epimerase GalE [Ancylobacter sonchi]|uniref:UDP-glucose 4-epimerase GalE n=1 Tax=Ancylobacter sonchi TaxID=1937790 RepID=UPI001FE41B59|nr:UDP-glucose 4-epimerase GalE [Ancylobacter sonchi]